VPEATLEAPVQEEAMALPSLAPALGLGSQLGLAMPFAVGTIPRSGSTILTRHWAHKLQRSAGNAALARFLAAGPMIQRQPPDTPAPADHEKALADIQGNPMYALLPLVEKLDPAVRSDEGAAQKVGGPRLVTAIHAVNNKGNWKAFSEANSGMMTELPLDQIGDLMRYVGAPGDVKTFERSQFDGRFDAQVDPTTGILTLICRVAFEKVEAAQYGGVMPGAKGYDESNEAAFGEFAGKFKAAVEAVWSGTASVTAKCPGFKVPTFLTKVSVVINGGGQPHVTFKIYGVTSSLRSNVDAKGGSGQLQIGDADKQKKEQNMTGYPKLTSEQVTAAHEFGHQIGLQHVACDSDTQVCYGTSDSEYGDIMGGGMKVQSLGSVSKRTGGHDDLAPFEKIAERWGKDVFPAALQAKCNVWTRA
jgi:hypothetical protein